LHILGAGINRLGRPALPAPMDVDLALALAPDSAAELPGEHVVEIVVKSDSGDEVAQARLQFRLDQIDLDLDPLPVLPVPVSLRNVAIATYGYYVIDVSCDGKPIANQRFTVEKQISGATQQVSAAPVPFP
jgi:phosphatidate phosphatase APP1